MFGSPCYAIYPASPSLLKWDIDLVGFYKSVSTPLRKKAPNKGVGLSNPTSRHALSGREQGHQQQPTTPLATTTAATKQWKNFWHGLAVLQRVGRPAKCSS